MNLFLSRIFRTGVALVIVCVFCTNDAFSQTRIQSVPDFREKKVTRKSAPTITMYDFQYSKSSYHYSSYPTEKSSTRAVASRKSRSQKSRTEKEFPSLLSTLTDKDESVARTAPRKRSLQKKKDVDLKELDLKDIVLNDNDLKNNDLEILEILPEENQISDFVPSLESLEEPSLIAAQPFEKIALHFDDSSYQEEKKAIKENISTKSKPQKESKKVEKIEMISMGSDTDLIEDRDQKTLKIESFELELTPPLSDEKTLSDEIDFDSVMFVFGEAFIASVQKSRIWQFSDNLPDVSLAMQSMNLIIAGR